MRKLLLLAVLSLAELTAMNPQMPQQDDRKEAPANNEAEELARLRAAQFRRRERRRLRREATEAADRRKAMFDAAGNAVKGSAEFAAEVAKKPLADHLGRGINEYLNGDVLPPLDPSLPSVLINQSGWAPTMAASRSVMNSVSDAPRSIVPDLSLGQPMVRGDIQGQYMAVRQAANETWLTKTLTSMHGGMSAFSANAGVAAQNLALHARTHKGVYIGVAVVGAVSILTAGMAYMLAPSAAPQEPVVDIDDSSSSDDEKQP